MKYRLACFDLDGTLIDSLPTLYKGVELLAQQHGLTVPTPDEVSAMIGKGVRIFVQRLLTFWGLPEEQLERFLQKLLLNWAQLGEHWVRFFPGVAEALQDLKAQGVKIALITNKDEKMTFHFLQQRKWDTFFDVVVAGRDDIALKPAPDMIELAMQKCACLPQETVMVGDSQNDALAAQAALVDVYLVRTGYNEGVDIDTWAKAHQFSNVYDSTTDVIRSWLSKSE